MNKLLLEFQNILDIGKDINVSSIFKVDLSRTEFVILKVIDDIETEKSSKTVAVSDIVDKMEVSAQAISKCLKNLENKEYIERYSNREDRRRMEVMMTQKGTMILDNILERIEKIFKSVLEGFDKEEFDEYLRLTRKFKDLCANALQIME